MLWNFLDANRAELIARCRRKVAARPGRVASAQQLQNGIPLFLAQLIRTLKIEQSAHPLVSRHISGPSGGAGTHSEMGAAAAEHGKSLLELGFTVDQVVHDYGDLCQSIAELAMELATPFETDEFRTLNRCLDNAIAEAVREFSSQRDSAFQARNARDANLQLGHLMHELRNQLGTMALAFAAAKAGRLSLDGATGAILERSIGAMRTLVNAALDDVKGAGHQVSPASLFSLTDLLAEASAAAALSAQDRAVEFHTGPVDGSIGLQG